MTATDSRWFADPNEVIEFAGILVRADWLDTAQEVLDYLEKPHKYDPEYELWVGCGRPDLDDQGWDWFARKLEELAGL
jgi:hypothetical protein